MGRGTPVFVALSFAFIPLSAAVEELWQLGTDDGRTSPFRSESYQSNAPPGSASKKDDDYYFAGLYPDPIGLLAVDEDVSNVERALTETDSTERFHFPLPASALTAEARLTLTVDLISGGAWTGVSQPGFQTHDVAVRFNGAEISQTIGLHSDTTLVLTLPATSVSAMAENNIVEIQRTGGAAGGYIQLDYLRLVADPTALRDSDADGMPEWFELAYLLDDSTAADASGDEDADGLTALDEFLAGTNPTDPDSDNDGLADGAETTTDPTKRDSDGDGLTDGEEVSTNPLQADSDSDGFADPLELEAGSDPNSAASTPFPFAGGIGMQFVSERPASKALGPDEPAGVIRLNHWNTSSFLPSWPADYTPIPGSKSGLLDSLGQPTSASISWTCRYASSGYHKGRSDEALLSGFIAAAAYSYTPEGASAPVTVKVPVTVEVTGIPFPTYDLIVYVGDDQPNHRGAVRIGGNPATDRFFVSNSSPPFSAWREISATTVEDIVPANYVRYRHLSGSTQNIELRQLDNDRVAIHGIQIIDTASDSDLDGIPDAAELEAGLNPAIDDASADADDDGLGNADELAAGTDPWLADSDHDGIADGDEAANGTLPLNGDTDGDGLADGEEIHGQPFSSSPLLADTDEDGFSDPTELDHGSDPNDPSSHPGGVPVWDGVSQTWRWRVDNLRVLWDHRQSMTGALNGRSTDILRAVTELEGENWTHQLSFGLYFRDGRLTHEFSCTNLLFHDERNPAWGLYARGSTSEGNDRTRDFGFSGFGDADDSHPLGMEMTAVRPDPAQNRWTVTFTLFDQSDEASPLVLATAQWTGCPAAAPGLQDGSARWTSIDDEPDRLTLETATGVEAYFTRDALGPVDSDSDGMPDDWEVSNVFLPMDPTDAPLDADGDTLSNLRECLAGTDPHLADSDNDGVSDATEFALGTSPRDASSAPAWLGFSGNISDLDGDGLSDAWVLWAGGKPRNPMADDDRDGLSNKAESEAGTDPDDPQSRFQLHARSNGADLELEWTSVPHKKFGIESATSLGDWTPLESMPAVNPGAGGIAVVLEDVLSGGGDQFYRASVGPLDSDGDGVEDWAEAEVLQSAADHADSLGMPGQENGGTPVSGDARALYELMSDGTGFAGATGTPAPPSAIHASRFLLQSTFGPTPEDIDHLRAIGFSAWLDEQFALPPSLLQPYIRRIKEDLEGPQLDLTYSYNADNLTINGENITTPWARNAIAAPDQLRQRVAFALSEILVISRRNAQLEQKPEALANYYDHLISGAFGSYADPLTRVALHPAMGWYLSHVGNQKADPSIPRYPDENFAREIMQLFTIGLWELNPDGTRKLDSSGDPIPTYDNGDITELARVFTGLYYDAPYGWGGGGWSETHFLKPMVMYADRHDFEAKRLPHGKVIPARAPSDEAGMQDVRDAIQALVRHPNTAPFISRRLIQFLVTDNPTPDYVGRVSGIFSATDGNLGEVVRAILLDPEARKLPLDPTFGKVREPVIRTMHLGRIGGLAAIHPDFVWWNSESRYYGFSFQEPLYSPSVFNFFTPEYQAPGEIREQNLVSPGFQIIDSYSSISFPNRMWDYLREGFSSSWSGPRYPLDFSSSLLVADDPEALVERLNLLVCAGSMTTHTRQAILNALASSDLTDEQRVAIALWTAITCPEGSVQR